MQYLYSNLCTYVFARDLNFFKNHGIKKVKVGLIFPILIVIQVNRFQDNRNFFGLNNPFSIFRQDSIHTIFDAGTLRHSN